MILKYNFKEQSYKVISQKDMRIFYMLFMIILSDRA